ncbi:hypothetical protein B0T18DRAFT_34458 [Schizothecium vesticola]|uniref:Uncharacterized protein n=1 Tax=Schizothecium vesticola TaxID=314040 RepID=A0AA40FAY5_9PEZI|nr:hypothetical protein B0T18DRAFT_34458 [Schizothecium vesticola]
MFRPPNQDERAFGCDVSSLPFRPQKTHRRFHLQECLRSTPSPCHPRLDRPSPARLFVALAPLPPANSMSTFGTAVAGDFRVSVISRILFVDCRSSGQFTIGLTICPRPRHLPLISPSDRSCHSSCVLAETPRAAPSQGPIQTT